METYSDAYYHTLPKGSTYIITYKIPYTNTDVDLVRYLGGLPKYGYDIINGISAILTDDIISNLIKDPNILAIHPVFNVYAKIIYDKKDNIYYRQYIQPNSLVHTMVQTIPWGISKIRAPDVWSTGNKGTGIKIGVLDSGIDYNHEDLSANYKGGHSYYKAPPPLGPVDNDNPMDDFGHGTHIAGIIAATYNDLGIVGVAPEAHLYALKIMDNCGNAFSDDIMMGINWCTNWGIQIINMSFGTAVPIRPYSDDPLVETIKNASNSGIIFVAAAGNSCDPKMDNTNMCTGDASYISYPASDPKVIAVGATDINDSPASFSSRGKELIVSAPGGKGGTITDPSTEEIYSTIIKTGCTCSVIDPCTGQTIHINLCDPSGYTYLRGSSMAVPHVVGAIALIKKAHPTWNFNQIKNAITNTATNLTNPNGWNRDIGYGRIDAYSAVNYSQGG